MYVQHNLSGEYFELLAVSHITKGSGECSGPAIVNWLGKSDGSST